jgi:hypothetical protein
MVVVCGLPLCTTKGCLDYGFPNSFKKVGRSDGSAALHSCGIPLVGILTNTGLFIHLSGTMNLRFATLESKVESRFERMDARFDTLMGKVIDIDNRLIRVEDWMGIKP